MGLLCIFLVSYITASSLEEVEIWASASDYATEGHNIFIRITCLELVVGWLVAISSFCD